MERTIEKVEFNIPQIPRAERVAAYARVSTYNDAMHHSLVAQIEHYSGMIQNHPGWLFAGVYADEDFTGTCSDRDDFQRMLTDCRNGKIDRIITKTISRFARNTVTLLESVRELKLLGIDVYFEEQNIHTLSGSGELMLTILASFAQAESLSVSENCKWRIRHGFESGEMGTLRFMFGYDISKGSITVNPEEAEIVREIYRRVAAGETMGSIARDMNSRGIDRPFGGKWSTQSIRTLIANEKYLGNALLQKTFVNNHLEKKKVCNNGELPQYYAEGTHDAIVDPELFEAANKVLRGLAEKIGHKTVSHDAFTGLIRCTDCGMNYKRITVHGKIKYACRTFVEKGKARCPSKAVPIETLQSEAAAVLGLPEFNEEVFSREIVRIDIPAHNHLVFVFNDGNTVERVWKDRSRSQSWTPEMKEAARQRAIKQRREKKCQEQ